MFLAGVVNFSASFTKSMLSWEYATLVCYTKMLYYISYLGNQ